MGHIWGLSFYAPEELPHPSAGHLAHPYGRVSEGEMVIPKGELVVVDSEIKEIPFHTFKSLNRNRNSPYAGEHDQPGPTPGRHVGGYVAVASLGQ